MQTPSSARNTIRERDILKDFLKKYESGTWKNATIEWPEDRNRTEKAVDLIARCPSGRTLAIEHTIIEPFVGEKGDFSHFSRVFLSIEEDQSLIIPGFWLRVFIPVGILQNRSPQKRMAIKEAIHDWLRENKAAIPEGDSVHSCQISGIGTVDLTTKVVPLRGPGRVHIRRQQLSHNLDEVVEKALKTKIPKLAAAPAERKILLLERQHMNLLPALVLAEIERRKSTFPELADVHEIWFVETMGFESESLLYFESFNPRHRGFDNLE